MKWETRDKIQLIKELEYSIKWLNNERIKQISIITVLKDCLDYVKNSQTRGLENE